LRTPWALRTQATWFTANESLIQQAIANQYNPLGCLHAMEHAMISFLPLFILGDARDMGGASFPKHPQTQSATFFLYDEYQGGIGYAQEAFHIIQDLARATLDAVRRCPCTSGCYACIQSAQCGGKNHPLDKAGAIFMLSVLVGDTVLR
jgi:DEAD/DEAH box helicase domain-containing protein